MVGEVVCLVREGRLTARDRHRHFGEEFPVPRGARRLEVRFRYAPGEVGGFRNLLTLSLFDPQGFRGSAHRWQVDQDIVLTGDRATPGFLPGPLHPGGWVVQVDTHEVLNDGTASGWCRYRLEVRALVGDGRSAAARADPRGEPPGPARLHRRPGWYRGDLHSHSIHCDGADTVEEMARAAGRLGLDFLAMTCHNTTSWLADLPDWPGGVLPIRGMELTSFRGHANLLGVGGWVDWRTGPSSPAIAPALREAASRGATVVINHPKAVGNPACTGCSWEWGWVDLRAVHAIEVWNGPWSAPEVGNPDALALWTDLLNQGYRIPAVAGTDSHEAAGYRASGLGFTWVRADGLGEPEVLAAVREGRSFLSRGPRIRLSLPTGRGVREVLPGSELTPEELVRVVIGVEGLSSPATLRWVGDGEALEARTVRPPGGSVPTTRPPTRWGRWELWAATAPTPELLALTNPVYVKVAA